MCKFPYSRRRRERFFHQLWIYLLLACGVMFLILITLFQEKERFVLVSETDFPVLDDPFPTGYRPPEQVVGLTSHDKMDYTDELSSSIIGPKTDADANILSILPNVSLKLDPALIRSGQYHYTNIIVHFDLKGAPPKVGYFLSLLQLVADAGATGILIEWEDMFPWSGELEIVKSTNAYTVKEVQHILKKAQSLGLEVIPLVQTFGHMEWILKYEEFRFLRDDDRYPQVICLGNKKAMNLIKEAIRQVVDIHLPYGIQHFHIGADEAFKYGTCSDSLKLLKKYDKVEDIAMKHIVAVAKYAMSITEGAKILAWHDMIKTFSQTTFIDHKVDELLELVIWDYSEQLIGVSDDLLRTLGKDFPKVWASSAYKGANFPAATFANLPHYEANNLHWLTYLREYRRSHKSPHFEGIIITGWSRYDHMATLCELLPTGTPSMVVNIQIALIGADKQYDSLSKKTVSIVAKTLANQILGCEEVPNYVQYLDVRECKFPGREVYNTIEYWLQTNLKHQEQFLRDSMEISGWLSRYNYVYNISQNWHLNNIKFELRPQDLYSISKRLGYQMRGLFHVETVDEFLYTKVDPALQKLISYAMALNRLRSIRTYERRSFKIIRKNFAAILEQLEQEQKD
ncbi:hypothetical protein V3C99_016304 [Haemonchus contortus]